MAETIIKVSEVFDKPVEGWNFCDGFEVTTDEQVIKLYISNGQSCCENWGYFMSEDDFDRFIGAELLDVTITDIALNTQKLDDVAPYSFDWGDIMFVNLETTAGLLQFAAYNAHNGYYGHSAYVVSEQLNHEVAL